MSSFTSSSSHALEPISSWLGWRPRTSSRPRLVPASTCPALAHSIHVYHRLHDLFVSERQNRENEPFIELSDSEEETIAICGLLHDICKANFYAVEMRNRKNEQGQWEKYPFYVVNDQLPYGHGEKSVYIISGFMKLTREEAMAIRWHMGFSDNDFRAGGFSVGNAFEKFPLALLTHMADLQATYLDEPREDA